MKMSRIVMGMPATIQIVGGHSAEEAISAAFDYLDQVDAQFSTYKPESEISRFNRGEIEEKDLSIEMQEVFALAEQTKQETNGYFDIRTPSGALDPSGIVKGWSIRYAAHIINEKGFTNYLIEIGGDIASLGVDEHGNEWSVGIRNPFDATQIVKVIYPRGHGVATSGTAERGNHIYNPHDPTALLKSLASITVIGPDVCEADRFATAAFAMEENGVHFIENLGGFEAYAIDQYGIATFTSNFNTYL